MNPFSKKPTAFGKEHEEFLSKIVRILSCGSQEEVSIDEIREYCSVGHNTIAGFIADHPKTPVDVLRHMLLIHDEAIAAAVVHSPNATEQLVAEADQKIVQPRLRLYAASSPYAPEWMVLKCLHTLKPEDRRRSKSFRDFLSEASKRSDLSEATKKEIREAVEYFG